MLTPLNLRGYKLEKAIYALILSLQTKTNHLNFLLEKGFKSEEFEYFFGLEPDLSYRASKYIQELDTFYE